MTAESQVTGGRFEILRTGKSKKKKGKEKKQQMQQIEKSYEKGSY